MCSTFDELKDSKAVCQVLVLVVRLRSKKKCISSYTPTQLVFHVKLLSNDIVIFISVQYKASYPKPV